MCIRDRLEYVSGINKTLARNIVAYREENGAFKSRKQLLKVAKLGPKAFEPVSYTHLKDKVVNLTEQGVKKVEEYFHIETWQTLRIWRFSITLSWLCAPTT